MQMKLCSFSLHELKQTKFWAVKVCNSDCLTVWNRDINAARNIGHVFLDLNANGGKRPLAFSRKTRA
ncbi:hypothetical protein MP638_002402 [Amoeboaphelidium occidentale]|nr:hypothetical protein MP638_002402 [Amoeboaphelidium occidentale]